MAKKTEQKVAVTLRGVLDLQEALFKSHVNVGTSPRLDSHNYYSGICSGLQMAITILGLPIDLSAFTKIKML